LTKFISIFSLHRMKISVNSLKQLVNVTFFAGILAVTSSCSSFNEGVSEDVTILSYPSGADVTIAGSTTGKTPLTIPLGKKIGHDVRVSLAGYQTYSGDILPQLNDGGRPTVKFGIAEQTGAYNDLSPNPLIAILKPNDGKKVDNFEIMMSLIEVNDQRFRAGRIDQKTHRHINQQIIAHFSPKK